MACRHCGGQLEKDAKFCAMCGKPAADSVTGEQTTPAVPVTVSEVPVVEAPASVVSETQTTAAVEPPVTPTVVPAAVVPAVASNTSAIFSGRAVLLLVLTLLAITVAAGWWYGTYRSVPVVTECYQLSLPASFSHDYDETFGPVGCNLTAQHGNDSVVINLASPQITEAGLQQAAKQAFGANLPAADIVREQAVQFAGEPAYRISGTNGANSVVYYYVYDRQASVRINNRSYHAYRIAISSRGDADALAKKVEQSWQWRARTSK